VTLPPGFTIRPIDPANDLAAVLALVEACDREDVGEPDLPESWIVQTWKSELLRGAWLVHDGEGGPAAYIELESRDTSKSIDAFLPIHPRHRDGPLLPALFDLLRERAAGVDTGSNVPLWLSVSSGDAGFARDALAAGFRHVRVFQHMEREVDPTYVPGDPPFGVTIRSALDPDDDRIIHELLEETFRGHFGIEPTTFELFQTEFKDEMYDASLVLIAEVDGRPVGVAANWMPDDLGWVGDLGVLSGHRGRGIGAALLRASFAALAARGVTKVRLNVDSENETGATRLYSSVGMTVRRSFDIYEARLGG
jgi:ribosomal protein S18 acetylase RimI-like enzyme